MRLFIFFLWYSRYFPLFNSYVVYTPRESSRVESSQTLETRGVHTDRVESNQVCASSSGFLVLFEQWTIKELWSDGKF